MALAAAAAAAPAWQALVGGGPLDRVAAAGAAEALARAGLLRQAGDALVAEGALQSAELQTCRVRAHPRARAARVPRRRSHPCLADVGISRRRAPCAR